METSGGHVAIIIGATVNIHVQHVRFLTVLLIVVLLFFLLCTLRRILLVFVLVLTLLLVRFRLCLRAPLLLLLVLRALAHGRVESGARNVLHGRTWRRSRRGRRE